MLRIITRSSPALAASCVLLLAACGGGSDEAEAQVASLRTAEPTLDDAADAAVRTDDQGGDLTADEAALEFSRCMRDEGLDFPDLSVDAEGNIELREAFQSIDRQAEGFREARQACGEVLQQAGFGGGRRQALESPEIQDSLLEFSACVRTAGYDVGDLTLGGPGGPGAGQGPQGDQEGQGTAADGDQGDGQGQQGQGFANRGQRFADQLGLDNEDPAVQETIESCLSIIDDAFSAAGIGQPAAGGRP